MKEGVSNKMEYHFENTLFKIKKDMILKIKNTILLALIILSCSCADNEKNVEYINENNLSIKELKLNKLELDDEPLRPSALCFVDSFLITFEMGLQTNFISVYDKNKLLKKFGTRGNGPNDMINPRCVSKGRCEQRYLNIGTSVSYKKIDIEKLTQKDSLVCIDEYVPEEVRLFNYLLLNNDTITISSRTCENQLTFYNKTTGIIQEYSFFNRKLLGRKVSQFIYNMQVYPATYAYNDGTIVIAYQRQKSIDMVSSSGKLKKQIRFEGYDYNNNKVRIEDNNAIYDDDALWFFSTICTTDEAFYVVCQDEIMLDNPNSKVYKFDWEGNLLERYDFKEAMGHPVVYKNVIYAITYTEDDELQISYAEL